MHDAVGEPRRMELQRRVIEAAQSVPADARGEARVLTGAPARVLADATHDVDVLVTGARGRGPVRSVLAGSVARHVVDRAACPVVVVPRGAHVGARQPELAQAGAA